MRYSLASTLFLIAASTAICATGYPAEGADKVTKAKLETLISAGNAAGAINLYAKDQGACSGEEERDLIAKAMIENGDQVRALSLVYPLRNARDPQIQATCALALALNNKPGAALKQIDSALKENDKGARSWAIKGYILYALQEKALGEAAFARARNLDKTSYDAARLESDAHLKLHEGEKAKSILANYIKSKPDDARARIQLSELCKKTGDYKDGISTLSAILKKNPDHIIALPKRAKLYRLDQQYKEAVVDYSRYMKLRTKDGTPSPMTYIDLARCQDESGKYEDAIETRTALLNKIGTKHPPREIAIELMHRADDYARLKKYDLAIKDLDELLKQYSEQSQVLEKRALYLEELGKYDEALKDINRLIARQPEWADWWVRRAAIEERLGRKHEALEDRKKAEKLKTAL